MPAPAWARSLAWAVPGRSHPNPSPQGRVLRTIFNPRHLARTERTLRERPGIERPYRDHRVEPVQCVTGLWRSRIQSPWQHRIWHIIAGTGRSAQSLGQCGFARAAALRLQFVGCGDAFGSGGRFNTCFRVERPAGDFLIDCGASTLIAFRKLGIDPNAVGTIFVSHRSNP